MRKLFGNIIAILIAATLPGFTFADYEFSKATPVGSWQLREETRTDHKGRTSVTIVRSSLVGEENFEGEAHYWLELEMQEYKVKKEKRKKKGDRTIVKVLIPKAKLDGHLESAFILKNIRDLSKKLIIQSGNQTPILIEGSGFLADTMLKFLGIELNYSFEPQGQESVEVPAGKFSAQKVAAKGSGSAKVLIKRTTIESDSSIWVSNSMPFGLVKSVSNDVINGKQHSAQAVVLEFGKSGASSQITQEPKTMSGSLMGN